MSLRQSIRGETDNKALVGLAALSISDDVSSFESLSPCLVESEGDRDVVSCALSFALELDVDDSSALDSSVVLEERVRQRISSCFQAGTSDDSISWNDSRRLLSSANSVDIVVEKGDCDVWNCSSNVYTVLGRGSFSSVRANCKVTSLDVPDPDLGDAFVFEVQLHTSGIMQIGWVTDATTYTSEDGVGDSKDSYAFDGKRVRKWNLASMPYGEQWTAGDVIGCGFNFDLCEVRYWRNGKDLGVAFPLWSDCAERVYYPAVSVSYGESCELNFGNLKFMYDYTGYRGIVEPIGSGGDQGGLGCVAKYVFNSLERLTIVGLAKNRSSPRAAAAHAALHAEEYFGLDDEDDLARMKARESLSEPSSCDQLMSQVQGDASRALVKQAQAIFQNEYLIDRYFMDACRRMNNYDCSGAALYRFLELVALGIDDDADTLSILVTLACHYTARRVMGNIWCTDEDPELCDGIVCSFIWQGFMNTPAFAQAWVNSDEWQEDFERFFFVRQPTNQDMSEMIPASVDGDVEEVLQTLLYPNVDDTMLQSDIGLIGIVSNINRFFSLIDDVHAILLEQLMAINKDWDAQRYYPQEFNDSEGQSHLNDYLDRYEANQVTEEPRETWVSSILDVMMFEDRPASKDFDPPPPLLRSFVSYVARKNLDVNREVVPPGVSDRSVICSLLSFMARASRRIMREVHLEGRGFLFPRQVFLRGMRTAVLGSPKNTPRDSADDLAPDSRLGGGVSFLCKQSIVDACRRGAHPLAVPSLSHSHASDWSIPMELRPRAVFMEGTPRWSWWIVNQCFVLFYLGGAQNITKITTFMSTFEMAMTSYKNLMEKLKHGDADLRLIDHSMEECKSSMLSSLRLLMWHLNWLMPRWKQQTYSTLACTISRVLLTLQEDPDTPEVSYVPEFYVDGAIQMLLACRGRESSAFAFEGDCLQCFDSFLELCVRFISDKRVVNPRVQNKILNAVWMLLRDEDTSYFVSRSEYARAHLFPALIAQFEHSRNWIHASNAFHLIVQHGGMSPRIETDEGPSRQSANRALIRTNLRMALKDDPDLAARLISCLVERLNWISPELITIIEELNNQVRSHAAGSLGFEREALMEDASLNYRRALAACDLAYHLLRLLELACESSGVVVLDSENSHSDILSTRLAELVGWSLRNFSPSSQTYKMASEVHMQAKDGGLRLGRDIRPSLVRELLGPCVGILVALWGTLPRVDGMDTSLADGFVDFLGKMHDLGITGALVQECFDDIADHASSGLESPTGTDKEAVLQTVCRLNKKENQAQGRCIDPPDDFLDPILNVLMSDPVILPSGVRLDRKTIQRHLAISQTDPFTMSQMKEEDLVDDVELRTRVQEWLDMN
jgi:hypothetical protein